MKTAYAIEARTQGYTHWSTLSWYDDPRTAKSAIPAIRRLMRKAGVRGVLRITRHRHTPAGWMSVGPESTSGWPRLPRRRPIATAPMSP